MFRTINFPTVLTFFIIIFVTYSERVSFKTSMARQKMRGRIINVPFFTFYPLFLLRIVGFLPEFFLCLGLSCSSTFIIFLLSFTKKCIGCTTAITCSATACNRHMSFSTASSSELELAFLCTSSFSYPYAILVPHLKLCYAPPPAAPCF